MGFSTDAIHVGQEPDPSTGSIVAPIYQTSTYVQEALGKEQGLRLCAHQSSEPQSARALHGEIGRRLGGICFFVRHGGNRFRVSSAAAGGSLRALGIGVWRRVSIDDATSGAIRNGIQLCGYVVDREGDAGAETEHQDALRGDADQSDDDCHGFGGGGPAGERARA